MNPSADMLQGVWDAVELSMDENTHDHLVYEASRKSTGVAYILWLFLGFLGAHRFYLGRTGTAITQLIMACTIVGLIPLALWWLIDGFKMPGMVQDENIELIQQMQSHGRFADRPRIDSPDPQPNKPFDPRVEEIREMRRR